jgi:hypothetical protein
VQKYVGLRRRLQETEARRFTRTHTPELIRAYQAFAEASQSGASRQPFKGRDLWRILESTRPRSIVELGSGTTSAVFALWASRTASSYLAFEHDTHWASVTEDCLKRCELLDGVLSRIRFVSSRVRDDHRATGFVEAIGLDADFIYVDGPPCRLANGHKVPNDDVTRLFDAGGLPRVIVVDGRVETVELIRSHPRGSRYQFFPSFVYSLRRGNWLSAIAGREHTVFIRT